MAGSWCAISYHTVTGPDRRYEPTTTGITAAAIGVLLLPESTPRRRTAHRAGWCVPGRRLTRLMIAEATLRVRVFGRIEKVQIELRPGVEVYLRQVLVDLSQARAKPRAGRIERIDIHAQTAAERDTDTLPSLAHHPVRWQDRGVQ